MLFHKYLKFVILHLLNILIFTKDLVLSQSQSYDMVIVITNQDASHHHLAAEKLQKNLYEQASRQDANILVKITSKDFSELSTWLYFPLIRRFGHNNVNGSWYIFVEEFCSIDLLQLSSTLKEYDHDENLFLGRAVVDSESSIIHHFDSVDPRQPFHYPDPRTAIIISRNLFNSIYEKWDSFESKIGFSIDTAYEFSKFIFTILSVRFKNLDSVCIRKRENCAVWIEDSALCSEGLFPISLKRIHFAVKTCSILAPDRIPILQKTWLPDVPNVQLYSDIKDELYGTISLNVPNVSKGHCGKTLAIIKKALTMEDIDWLVIADDDTLISVHRLAKFLSCYDPSLPFAIGERYAYMGASESGYEYLTGGAGFVLSRKTIQLLREPGVCECPSNDTPDDMFLGICLRRIGVPLIHSRRFHQARPNDYAESLLSNSDAISFHKFWLVDPIRIYEQRLKDEPENKPAQKRDSERTEL